MKNSKQRRDFLKTTVGIATITLMPGVFLQTAQAVANSKNRWGLLIDTNKCQKCNNECVAACNSEHNIKSFNRPKTDSQWIRIVEVKNKTTGYQAKLPVMCQHCEKPPCVDVCPTGASFKRSDGIVLVDRHICIGCRYCMMACPYKARNFVHENLTEQNSVSPRGKGCVESCTMCVHRVDKNGAKTKTACQEACPHGAIIFGDLKNKKSLISQTISKKGAVKIRSDFNLNQAVSYQGLAL
jgi:tetrathionate reductase subunit B